MRTPKEKIRFAGENDSDMIVSFIHAMLEETASFGGHEVNADDKFWLRFRETIAERVDDPDRLYMIVEISDRIVAFLEGHIQKLYDTFAPKRSFHINGVYVIPENRRQGIANSLVQEALRWARENECGEADLNVLVENGAKNLYEKTGFKAFQHEMRMKL